MSERECRTFEKSLPILRHRHCWASSVPVWCPCPERNLTFRRMRQRLMHRQSAGIADADHVPLSEAAAGTAVSPEAAAKRLEQPEIRRFLLRYGYTTDMDLAACLMRLQNRIAEKPEFPMRSEFFWGTLWKMWTALSRIRGRTASCAVVGKCTETWNRHAGHLPAMRSAEYFSVQS